MDVNKIIEWLSKMLSKLFSSIKSFFSVTKKVQERVAQQKAPAKPSGVQGVAPSAPVAPPTPAAPPAPVVPPADMAPDTPASLPVPDDGGQQSSENLLALANDVKKEIANNESAFHRENPIAGSFRRLNREGAVSPWSYLPNPYSVLRNTLPESWQRSLGIVPYPKGTTDLKEDALFLHEPVTTGVGIGIPAAIAGAAIKRRGLLAAAKIFGKSLMTYGGAGALAADTIYRNRPALGSLIYNIKYRKNFDLGKTLKDFSRETYRTGEKRLKYNPFYEDALSRAAPKPVDHVWDSPEVKLWKQWLIDSIVDPGTLLNTLQVMRRKSINAGKDIDLSKKQLTNRSYGNAARAIQLSEGSGLPSDLVGRASRAGDFARMKPGDRPGVQPNAIVGAGERNFVHEFLGDLNDTNEASPVFGGNPVKRDMVDTAKLNRDIGKLTFKQKDKLQRLSDYSVPDTNAQYSARSSFDADTWNKQHPQQAAIAARQNRDIKQQRNAWIRRNYNRDGSAR